VLQGKVLLMNDSKCSTNINCVLYEVVTEAEEIFDHLNILSIVSLASAVNSQRTQPLSLITTNHGEM
jgi:hypothetical protein